MSETVQFNPFARALAMLEAEMPDTFKLLVDDYIFTRIPLCDAAKALAISESMENMKHKAALMGYVVTTTHDASTRQWVYGFVKQKPAQVTNPVDV